MVNFLKKNKVDEDSTNAAKKNWYEDRYQTVIVQRNLLVVLVMLSLAGVMFSTFAVIQVTSSKSIEPFVIEVEEKTGVTNVIRPLLKEQFTKDEVLREYFIMKYMNARETYDYASYEYNYNKVVRLLSSQQTFSKFRRQLTAQGISNPTKLGRQNTRSIKIRSMAYLDTHKKGKGYTLQVRFVSQDRGINLSRDRNLMATINFNFIDMEFTKEERNINPLGFQVTGYRVDEETL